MEIGSEVALVIRTRQCFLSLGVPIYSGGENSKDDRSGLLDVQLSVARVV